MLHYALVLVYAHPFPLLGLPFDWRCKQFA